MSWARTIAALLKFKIATDKLKKTHTASRKIAKADASDLEWKDIKFLSDPFMELALRNAQQALTKANLAKRAKFELPRNTAQRDFGKALKDAEKKGPDHKHTLASLEVYAYNLKRYCKELDTMASELFHFEDQLMEKADLSQAHSDYGDRLHDAFMVCAKVPDPKGTMQNAKFLALANDAMSYKSTMSTVAGIYRDLAKEAKDHFKALHEEMDNRWAWIEWAESAKSKEEGALKKNKSAKKPKR